MDQFVSSWFHRSPKIDAFKALVAVACFWAVSFLSSCSTPFDSEEVVVVGPGEVSKLFPLAVGNYWVYHSIGHVSETVDTMRNEILSRHEIMVDGRRRAAFGHQWLHLPSDARQFSFEWLWAHSDDGLDAVGMAREAQTTVSDQLQFRYPVEEGDTWSFRRYKYNRFQEGTIDLARAVEVHVASVDTVTSTPMGLLDGCILYIVPEISESDAIYILEHRYFVKPGLGVVAHQIWSDLGYGIAPDWELVRENLLVDFSIAEEEN